MVLLEAVRGVAGLRGRAQTAATKRPTQWDVFERRCTPSGAGSGESRRGERRVGQAEKTRLQGRQVEGETGGPAVSVTLLRESRVGKRALKADKRGRVERRRGGRKRRTDVAATRPGGVATPAGCFVLRMRVGT